MTGLSTLVSASAATPDLTDPVKGVQPVRFSDLSKRLTKFERSKQTFYKFNPEKPGPWVKETKSADGTLSTVDDYDSFKASLLAVEEEVRIYSIEGHDIKLVLKESYAKIQDEIRRLRQMLDEPDTRAEAEKLLAEHPYGKRALPEDFLQSIDELIDSSYFTRFLLLDESNTEDLWVRQVKKDYNSNFISSAAVEENGDVLFFKRDVEEYIRTDLFHEWNHRLAARCKSVEWMFQKAVLLEGKKAFWYIPSQYALTDFGEHWAVYGERMIASDEQVFEDVRKRSPVRAVIWMRALRQALESSPRRKSSIEEQLKRRCLETETLALQDARDFVSFYLDWQGPLPANVASPSELAKDLFEYLQT